MGYLKQIIIFLKLIDSKVRCIYKCFLLFRRHYFKKKFLLINTPEHGNLGDHAIAIAERTFLHKYFPDIPVVEITGDWLRKEFSIFRRFIRKEDIILMTGGGFLGSLWMREEWTVRNVINTFPENTIFIFPQTVFFEKTPNGNQELEISRRIYESHNKLYMCLRDVQSYEFVKKHFPQLNNIYLFPDMVTMFPVRYIEVERNGILLCLRKDGEKAISDSEKEAIIKKLRDERLEYRETTTVEKNNISITERATKVNQKLYEFQCSRLVITDRLHAMLFAAITGTPCIAYDNISKKVSGVYHWIRDLDYIKVVGKDDDICRLIDSYSNMPSRQFDLQFFEKYYLSMRNIICELL